jgi:hypothetical protein
LRQGRCVDRGDQRGERIGLLDFGRMRTERSVGLDDLCVEALEADVSATAFLGVDSSGEGACVGTSPSRRISAS